MLKCYTNKIMKKLIYIVLLAAVVVAGCRKHPITPAEPGTLQMTLSYGGEYKTKAADNANVSDFKVSIVRADGWKADYDRYGDMPQMLQLGSGSYTVSASSPADLPAAFDQPVYGGSADFKIVSGQVTPVSIVCGLTNMKVSFTTTENFRKELQNYTVTVTNAPSWNSADLAGHSLVWEKAAVDEGKEGYFSVAPLMIKVDGYRTVDNTEAHAELAVASVAAKDHHIINLDARVTGNAGIAIILDDTVTEKEEDVLVPGWDEVPVDRPDDPDGPDGPDDPDPPTPSTAPTMTWEANPDFSDTPISDQMDVTILIEAPEKIQSFVVTVDSDILADVIAALAEDASYSYAEDGPYDMDLIYNTTLVEALGGMGLGIPTGEELRGQTSVEFSLSNLIPMISLYAPAPGSRHTFTLTVVDEKGQSLQKPLTFVAP